MLWRRIEKRAENLLMEVDEFRSYLVGGLRRLPFSTVLT